MRSISLVVVVLMLPLGASCATQGYLSARRDLRGLDQILDVKISGEDQLYALVRYRSGLTRVLMLTLDHRADLYPASALTYLHVEIVDLELDAIEGRTVPVVSHDRARVSTSTTLVRTRSGFVVYQGEDRFWVGIEVPFDWLSPEPYVTFLLLPFPVVWDVVTSPIQLYAVLAIDDWP